MKNLLSNSVAGVAGLLTASISAVVGLGSSIAGPIGVAVAAVGAGALMFGGTRLVMTAVTPEPALLVSSGEDLNEQTAALLERVLQATVKNRDTLTTWQGRTQPEGRAHDVISVAQDLTNRIETLAQSEVIQRREPFDGTLGMLDGIATRYLPELMENLDDTIEFINKFSGSARQDALNNLDALNEQLGILGEALEKVERDIVKGTTHSLDVHSEFLRTRLKKSSSSPIIDV